MMLQDPTEFGAYSCTECSRIPKAFPVEGLCSSPTVPHVLPSHPRHATHSESPISPFTLSEKWDHGPSMLGKAYHHIPRLDAKKDLLSKLMPALEVAHSSKAMFFTSTGCLESLIAIDSSSGDVSIYGRGPIISEHSTSSLRPTNSAEHEQVEVSITDGKSLDLDVSTESALMRPRSSDVEIIPSPVTKAPTKRVQEIVAESQSCVHDYTTLTSNLAGRKNRKRTFNEYNRGLQDVDTRNLHIEPNKSEKRTAKRCKLSTA